LDHAPVSQKPRDAVSLATDYAKRLQRMQDRLDKEINKNVVVTNAVKVPKKTLPKVQETKEEKVMRELNESLKKKDAK